MFLVPNLSPGTEYMLSVASVNSQGTSSPISLIHFTPIDIAEETLSADTKVEKEEGIKHPDAKDNIPLVGMILGIITGVVMTIIIILAVLKVQRRFTRRGDNLTETQSQQEETLTQTEINESEVSGLTVVPGLTPSIAQTIYPEESCSHKDPDVIIFRGGECI